MKNIIEELKAFILQKVKENTTLDRPYFFIKWSGLFELCEIYKVDLLKLIDQMVNEGYLKKALIKGRLAVYLPEYSKVVNKKAKNMLNEFEAFLKSRK